MSASSASPVKAHPDAGQGPRLAGHPPGLFLLFFAEMWERFSYYGMRALLIYYMTKGFLGYGDNEAYKVYGAYVGLVYMTPFFGGLMADRILGAKRSVILGGLLMAAGHLMMTVEQSNFFFAALALLIVGNGFFKPNISTIVGSLYPEGDPNRDGGFTIFYMGINLGAALSPLLCGYVGETYGWHYGFGLATIGMLLGLAVFMIPGFVGQVLTTLCAVTTAAALVLSFQGVLPASSLVTANMVILVLLVIAGFVGFVELKRDESDQPPFMPVFPEYSRYLATFIVLVGSLAASAGTFYFQSGDAIMATVVSIPCIALVTAGIVGTFALLRGGLPAKAGAPDHPELLHRSLAGPITVEHAVYFGSLLVVPLTGVLVNSNRNVRVISDDFLDGLREGGGAAANLAATLLGEMSTPTGLLLSVTGLIAVVYLMRESFVGTKVERERLWVVLAMMFFSLVFWAFFEQAGSSMSNFTDRNIDRVSEAQNVAEQQVGTVLTLDLTQEQLGHVNDDPAFSGKVNEALALVAAKRNCIAASGEWKEGEKEGSAAPTCTKPEAEVQAFLTQREAEAKAELEAKGKEYKAPVPYTFSSGDALTLTALDALREAKTDKAVAWKVAKSNVGMGTGGTEVPASMFQSANPDYILLFGLVFSAMWTFLGKRGIEPSTPVKFSLGLLQLGLGFVALWWGAAHPDARGMVNVSWILLAYLLHTTGELCLSPVGLSMVTRLSPHRLVSTAMGAWFLATAFSGFLAAIIATFTGVGHGDDGAQFVPVPSETVHVYGSVFGTIAIAAVISAVICLAMAPLLTRWMHEEAAHE